MKLINIITSALIIAILTSVVGLTQCQTWEHFGMFSFAIFMSLFMLGLVATDK